MLKNKLKSPPSIAFLFIILRILFNISDGFREYLSTLFQCFSLLTSISSLSQIFMSNMKILPRLFLVPTTSKTFEPRKANAAPQNFVAP